MKELIINKHELQMIMSYSIGTYKTTEILQGYDEDGDKGTVISNLIREVCHLKYIEQITATKLKVLMDKLTPGPFPGPGLLGLTTHTEPEPERD